MATQKIDFYGRLVTAKQLQKIINQAAIWHLKMGIKYLQGKREFKPINMYPEAVELAQKTINNVP